MGVRKKICAYKNFTFSWRNVSYDYEFIKECDITVDGNSGYWKTYHVLAYNADEETLSAGFLKQRKIMK